MKEYKERAWLYRKYWTEGKSDIEIGRICGVHYTMITYQRRKFDIRGRTRAELAPIISKKLSGRILSKETREKMGIQKIGDKNPAKRLDVRQKMREVKLGKKTKPCSEETKRKIGEANSGEKHGSFQNWKSREPYGFDFSPELKLLIRQRDNFSCQICPTMENGRKFIPHHIDYDKRNNNKEKNFILLCQKCNSTANFDREKWQFLFEVLNEIRLC